MFACCRWAPPLLQTPLFVIFLRRAQPACGLPEGPLRDQWRLHHTLQVTDTPAAAYPFGHVVGLAALDLVQLWVELDVAGVGLAFAHLMAVTMRPDA